MDEIREAIENELDTLVAHKDIVGVLFVRRDGKIIGSRTEKEFERETVAFSSSLIVAALEKCAEILEGGKIREIEMDSNLGKVALLGVGDVALLACLIRKGRSIDAARVEMLRGAKKLLEIIS